MEILAIIKVGVQDHAFSQSHHLTTYNYMYTYDYVNMCVHC